MIGRDIGSPAHDSDGARTNGRSWLEGDRHQGEHAPKLSIASEPASAAASERAVRESIGEWLEMDPVDLAGLAGDPLSRIADALATGRAAVATVATQQEDIAMLQESNRMDSLTGIWNRRAIDQRLQTEWARWKRHNTPMAVLMADIDGLKGINDTRGHSSGDLLIGAVAGQFASLMRAEDAVGRLGGDEFMIVCAEADEESTQAIVRKMNDALAAQFVTVQYGAIPLRVSIGSASTTRYPNASLAELVGIADAGLYAVKRERPDQSRIDGEPSATAKGFRSASP